MRLFKKKNKIELSWNLTNDLKPNIKNYKDDYDKINALKCFLIRNNFSLDCIDEILENKNPFHEIINHFKQVGSGGLYNGGTIEEDTLYRAIRLVELSIIENKSFNKTINWLFGAFIDNILLSAGYMYTTHHKYLFSKYTYKEMLERLNDGEVVLDEVLMTAFHISFLRSNKDIDNFLSCFDWYWENGINTVAKQFAEEIGGEEYLKGLFYKNIENSIKNYKPYSAKKIIENNDVNTYIDADIHDILFSSDNDANLTLFKECFNDFKEDIQNIKMFYLEANNEVYNKYFDYELTDNILFNKDNYTLQFTPYTSTGRLSKYILKISAIFNIKNDFIIQTHLFYSKANLLERIEINLQSGDYERVIIVKKIDGELILDSIKEHNIFKDAFPITIYKKDYNKNN